MKVYAALLIAIPALVTSTPLFSRQTQNDQAQNASTPPPPGTVIVRYPMALIQYCDFS